MASELSGPPGYWHPAAPKVARFRVARHRSQSCMPEPPRRIHVPLKNTITLEAPGQSLRQGPEPGAFPVEPQRGAKLIQSVYYGSVTVAELIRPNNRSYTELAFSNKRFRVDHPQGSRVARSTLSPWRSW
jgi:hypothetical protein